MSLPFDTLKPRGPARIVGNGCSAMVSIYIPDERFVLKGSEVWLNGRCYRRVGNLNSKATLTHEDIVYKHVGPHPYILKYSGKVLVREEDTYSLKLERALGNLRKLILECPAPTEQVRLNMAVEIASSMAHVHSKNVFHGDFSCRNVLVFKDWLLKLGDFGGSKIDGQELPEESAAEESRYQLPLRGYGIYEILAWKAPFPELTEEEIEEKYANEEFLDTEGLLVGDVIRACWNEEFEAAADVEIALRKRLHNKKLPKAGEEYARLKMILHNFFTLLCNPLGRRYRKIL